MEERGILDLNYWTVEKQDAGNYFKIKMRNVEKILKKRIEMDKYLPKGKKSV